MTKKTFDSYFDKASQVFLPLFTIIGFSFTSLKQPQLGLIFNAIAQVFWLYSSYRAWKDARQIGIFITTIIISLIVAFGIMNYWFLS